MEPKARPTKFTRKAPGKVVAPKTLTRTREVPEPDRAASPVTGRQILEHAYWLGCAVKENDKKAMESEFAAMKVLARMYHTFASTPGSRPIKYSSDVENYPPPKKRNSTRLGDEEIEE